MMGLLNGIRRNALKCILLVCMTIFGFGIVLWLYSSMDYTSSLRVLYDPRVVTSYSRLLTSKHDRALIVWWNNMPESYNNVIRTERGTCEVSSERKMWREANVIVFYGSSVKVNDLPLPRSRRQLWALFHEESPRNVPFMPYREWLMFFNYTSTFSRYSDLPLTTYYLPSEEDLIGHKYVIPISDKSKHSTQALILFIQSDCDTLTGRDDYVRELMKFITIDSFGACLNNRDLPPSLENIQNDYLNHLYAPEMMKFIASYKFMISYENGICKDYITEKFWRPLIAGTVPLYFGTETVADWSPNENSYINIMDFLNPLELASYLYHISQDHEAYIGYLSHKYNIEPISNKRLLYELRIRQMYIGMTSPMQTLEFRVCEMLWNMLDEQQKGISRYRQADIMDYDCTTKPVHPAMAEPMTKEDDWKSVMAFGYCEARALNKLLINNTAFTVSEYETILDEEFLSMGEN